MLRYNRRRWFFCLSQINEVESLEIIIDMEVKWENEKGIAVLKNHVESVSYPVYDDYKDNSSEILKEILNTEEMNFSNENRDIEVTFPILKRFQT